MGLLMPAPPPDLIAKIRDGRVARHILLDMALEDETVRIWTGAGDLSYGGNDYIGVSVLGSIEGVGDTADLQAHQVRVTLAGIPTDAIAGLPASIAGAVTTLRAVYMTAEGRVHSASRVVFKGRGDYLIAKIGTDHSTVTAVLTSAFRDLRDPPGGVWTDTEQQRLYPDDAGLFFLSTLANRSAVGWAISTTGTDVIYLKWSTDGGFHLEDTALRRVKTPAGADFLLGGSDTILFPGAPRTQAGQQGAQPMGNRQLTAGGSFTYSNGGKSNCVYIKPAIAAGDGFVKVGGVKCVIGENRRGYVETSGEALYEIATEAGPFATVGNPGAGIDGVGYTSSYPIASAT
jgi:hypothetical protein